MGVPEHGDREARLRDRCRVRNGVDASGEAGNNSEAILYKQTRELRRSAAPVFGRFTCPDDGHARRADEIPQALEVQKLHGMVGVPEFFGILPSAVNTNTEVPDTCVADGAKRQARVLLDFSFRNEV